MPKMRPRTSIISISAALLAVAVAAFVVGLANGHGGAVADNPVGGPTYTPGGPRYTPESSGEPQDPIVSAALIAPKTAWALAADGLKRTTDLGSNWSDITPPGVNSEEILGVTFADAQVGWVAASRDPNGPEPVLEVYSTHDGGSNWSRNDVPLKQESVGNVQLSASGGSLWALVTKQGPGGTNSNGFLYKSTDAGATWSALPRPPIGTGSLEFVSRTEGWLAGGVGEQHLWRSSDGGRSWIPSGIGAPPGFDGTRTGYALPSVAADGSALLPVTFSRPGGNSEVRIFQTQDHGSTWSPLRSVPLNAEVPGAAAFAAAQSRGPEAVVIQEPEAAGVTVVAPSVEVSVAHAVQAPTVPGQLAASDSPARGLPADFAHLDFVDAAEGLALLDHKECVEGANCTIDNRILFSTDGGEIWHLSPSRP